MMTKMKTKQIRQNCWETNSSSTHSVTIQTKGSGKRDTKPLVENNVLYPFRLSGYSSSFGEASYLSCQDKESKAAIVAQWIMSEEDNTGYGKDKRDEYLDFLRVQLGYDKIDLEGRKCGDYYGRGEYDEPCLKIGSEPNDDEIHGKLLELVKVILDNTKEIIDSDTPY